MAAQNASTGGRFQDLDAELERDVESDAPPRHWEALEPEDSLAALDAGDVTARPRRRRADGETDGRTDDGPGADALGSGAPATRALSIVEGLILPRLRLAHGLPARPDALSALERSDWRSTAKAARAFAEYALACDASSIERHIERLLQSGWTLENVFLDLFEPSARRLGWLWENDLCSFVDVALAVSRMSTAGRKISAGARGAARPLRAPRRLLIMAAPDEAHRFGADLVAEMCRRHGWDASAPAGLSADDIVALATAEPFDAIGLSLTDAARASEAADLIRRLRRVARNAQGGPVGVIVGGGAFLGDGALALQIGADAMAASARAAPRQIADLLSLLGQRG